MSEREEVGGGVAMKRSGVGASGAGAHIFQCWVNVASGVCCVTQCGSETVTGVASRCASVKLGAYGLIQQRLTLTTVIGVPRSNMRPYDHNLRKTFIHLTEYPLFRTRVRFQILSDQQSD